MPALSASLDRKATPSEAPDPKDRHHDLPKRIVRHAQPQSRGSHDRAPSEPKRKASPPPPTRDLLAPPPSKRGRSPIRSTATQSKINEKTKKKDSSAKKKDDSDSDSESRSRADVCYKNNRRSRSRNHRSQSESGSDRGASSDQLPKKKKAINHKCQFEMHFGVTFARESPKCDLDHALTFTRINGIALPSDIPVCTDCRALIRNGHSCAVCLRCAPLFILCDKCFLSAM